MAAAVQSVLLVGTAAWLFYNTWLAVTALLPVGIWYWHEWREECCKRKEQLFREQFQNGIQILSSLLKAGYSVENAIRETEKDLRPLYREGSRIRTEFERMVRELDMNLTAEQVLTSFSKRVNQEDVNNFVTVFAAAKRTGGDSISIVKETVRIIGGKIETEREIQTVLAAKRLEFHVMCVIPLGMIGYMRMAFPEFLNVLYGNIPGVLLMTGCMVVYLFAYRLGNRIIKIEV